MGVWQEKLKARGSALSDVLPNLVVERSTGARLTCTVMEAAIGTLYTGC